jgi:putative membrane protein
MYEKIRTGRLDSSAVSRACLSGAAFILPGVSGGALAAVFGNYERLNSFLANLKKDFKKNLSFFIPVGLGWSSASLCFSFPIDYLLKSSETYVFVVFHRLHFGNAPGPVPAGRQKGLEALHLALTVVTCGLAYLFWKH